jgi:hypothetical protein
VSASTGPEQAVVARRYVSGELRKHKCIRWRRPSPATSAEGESQRREQSSRRHTSGPQVGFEFLVCAGAAVLKKASSVFQLTQRQLHARLVPPQPERPRFHFFLGLITEFARHERRERRQASACTCCGSPAMLSSGDTGHQPSHRRDAPPWHWLQTPAGAGRLKQPRTSVRNRRQLAAPRNNRSGQSSGRSARCWHSRPSLVCRGCTSRRRSLAAQHDAWPRSPIRGQDEVRQVCHLAWAGRDLHPRNLCFGARPVSQRRRVQHTSRRAGQ